MRSPELCSTGVLRDYAPRDCWYGNENAGAVKRLLWQRNSIAAMARWIAALVGRKQDRSPDTVVSIFGSSDNLVEFRRTVGWERMLAKVKRQGQAGGDRRRVSRTRRNEQWQKQGRVTGDGGDQESAAGGAVVTGVDRWRLAHASLWGHANCCSPGGRRGP
jgi:hypothetical protein